ncbi:MAG: carbon-nitrogen hydrolase family protein [Gammaproteobacteria bacterium]|nr:MAG: carbon-nitrogen hydrolase family protein [Gammaproteobacteria bacterium]
MKPFSIAALQLDLEYSDNCDLVAEKTYQAAKRYPWVQMVVLSELAVGGSSRSLEYSFEKQLPKFQDIAKELKIWYVPGSFYDHAGEEVKNVAPVISPEGDLVTVCTKTYPFLPYETGIMPGSEPCVFEVPEVGIFGMHICYDLWFPETSRALAMNGAQVILHPSLTDTCDRDEEKIMARATAIQQQCYYIDVNAGGKQGRGLSISLGPEGEILNESSEGEETVLIEIDTEKVDRVRKRGIKGLGQPLKSFRDNPDPFNNATINNNYLKDLGVLEIPKKE